MGTPQNASNLISLPKGGGALHGIGEKFSPDLHTGTGNFTIPITVPPGRNGFHPQLNLTYSTGNGNGPFGLGWTLSIPGIIRKTSKGIPRYRDLSPKPEVQDIFILSGAEDLVPVQKLDNSIHYRPRTEGLFARIVRHLSSADDYWEVRSKDGLISRYGTPRPPAAPEDWVDPAVISDPLQSAHIFAWKLTDTRDPFNNQIAYTYEADQGQIGPHRWQQPMLQKIQYVDYTQDDSAKYLISVTFENEIRPDAFSENRAGFEIRTTKRCRKILIKTHADREYAVRTYVFDYENDAPNGVSLLSQVMVEGHEGQTSESLPPLEFSYTQFQPQLRKFVPVTGSDLPPASLSHPQYELVDLFGRGMPDVLEMNGTVRYWRNKGAGIFDRPREMKTAPAGVRLGDTGVQLLDADGDGRLDLVVTQGALSGYYPLRYGGHWDPRSFQKYHQAPSFDLKDPEVHLLDLTGDGVIDALRSGTSLECFFNDPQKGFTKTAFIQRRALATFPNIPFSDPRVKWGDMNGDGLQDVMLVHQGVVEYWPNAGYGNWGARIIMKNSPHLPFDYDPKRVLIGDVDGDGLADLVYVDDGKVTLWLNQTGNGWSNAIVVLGTPSVSDLDAVRLVDLFGSGIAGVLWTTDLRQAGNSNYFFLDFTGGQKPYLLNEMNNHMGAKTMVEYVPSTRFFLEDEKNPKMRWKTPLPFPVQVVARVKIIDEVSQGKLTTEYRYHHGYWDGAEREFRGFGMVEQQDSEEFELYNEQGLNRPGTTFEKIADRKRFSPPTLTKTWFHQGPIGEEFGAWQEADYRKEYWEDDPPMFPPSETTLNVLQALPRRVQRDAIRTFRNSILRTELYALDATEYQDRPYTVTESVFGLREEEPPDPGAEPDRTHIFFPHLLAKRTTQWERGDDPMTQVTFTGDYDEFGQSCAQTMVALPRRQARRQPSGSALAHEIHILATHTRTQYAQPKANTNLYIHNRVAHSHTFELRELPGVSESEPQNLERVLQEQGNSAAAIHHQFGEVFKDWRPGQSVPDQVHLMRHTVNHYDGEAFEGLQAGEVGLYGAVTRTESLVCTDSELDKTFEQAYGDQRPSYLDGPGSLPPEAPTGFGIKLGYNRKQDSPDGYQKGYYVDTQRQSYDFHDPASGRHSGLLVGTQDALGHQSSISPDVYGLLPVEVTDPVGLKTTADYDYRVLQAKTVTDPNGNVTTFAFTPLGLLTWTMVKGKANGEGDQTRPSVQMTYDFLAFMNSPPDKRRPISIRTLRYVHHDTETDVPLPQRDQTIETLEYSDGFGRLLQMRTQGEDDRFGNADFGGDVLPKDQGDDQKTKKEVIGVRNGDPNNPNVVVSGWQVYDNKGRVVEKYEPFFDVVWTYDPPQDAQLGQKATLVYDPRGQLTKTVNPDGSEQRVVFGIPVDMANPERVTPTPWETYTYDTNDNAGRTHTSDQRIKAYEHHWNTPASSVVDALGRSIMTIERNRTKPASPTDPPSPIEEYRTRSSYDIQGNVLTVTDQLGRQAFRYVYDLAKHPLRTESIDAGWRFTVFDALGNPVEQRDQKGVIILREYDEGNRPTHLWACDGTSQRFTLREKQRYGGTQQAREAGLTDDQAKEANLLGKLHKHYDEAGLLTFERYDFKGNLLEKVRQVINANAILAAYNPTPVDWKIIPFRVDWTQGDPAPILDPARYQMSTAYDALNRVKILCYPENVTGGRKKLRPRYNRAGALEAVMLDDTPYVERIAYNAKGQRVLIAYGNGVMTRYDYDPQTFRLARLRTEPYTMVDQLKYQPTGIPLQDFGYAYDLAGNILMIHDRSPDSGIPNTSLGTNALDKVFTYDPLYRLLSATGRECDSPPPTDPWDDAPKCHDVNLTRPYIQKYLYDPAGNMTALKHVANNGSFTREFAIVNGTNRLANVTIGTMNYPYAYDVCGNMTGESASRHFEWDHKDRLRVFSIQAGTSEPSIHVHYLYDAEGQRVQKLVHKQGGDFEVAVYIDGVFEHHRWDQMSTSPKHNNHLHVMDNQNRIALMRIGDKHESDGGPAIQFHLGDHLGSSNVVIDETGSWMNREEHFPYGETSFGSFQKKRHRFTGKERDEESGLSYHGARYFATHLTKWLCPDPGGIRDGFNLYSFSRNNPICFIDKNGKQADLPSKTSGTNQSKISPDVQIRYEWLQDRINQSKLEKTSALRNATIAKQTSEQYHEAALKKGIWTLIDVTTFGLGKAGHLDKVLGLGQDSARNLKTVEDLSVLTAPVSIAKDLENPTGYVKAGLKLTKSTLKFSADVLNDAKLPTGAKVTGRIAGVVSGLSTVLSLYSIGEGAYKTYNYLEKSAEALRESKDWEEFSTYWQKELTKYDEMLGDLLKDNPKLREYEIEQNRQNFEKAFQADQTEKAGIQESIQRSANIH